MNDVVFIPYPSIPMNPIEESYCGYYTIEWILNRLKSSVEPALKF